VIIHHSIRPVPPGSTPVRELAHAIDQALALPKAAASRDEVIYLRIMRDRARLVRQAARRILADHEATDTDVMTAVTVLRAEAGQLVDDQPDYEPEPPP
jgi:hypothetical protein